MKHLHDEFVHVTDSIINGNVISHFQHKSEQYFIATSEESILLKIDGHLVRMIKVDHGIYSLGANLPVPNHECCSHMDICIVCGAYVMMYGPCGDDAEENLGGKPCTNWEKQEVFKEVA